MHHEISSLQNPFVKSVVALQKKRERKREGFFVVEGYEEISMAFEGSYRIDSLCYCLDLLRFDAKKLVYDLEKQGTHILSCSEELFRKMSYKENPEGILAVVETQEKSLLDLECTSKSIFVILENLEKPGNLGAILRSADAAGVTGVIVVDEACDIYNPNAIFASRGAVFTIPIVMTSNDECLKWLKQKQIVTIAATPEAKDSYAEFPPKMPCAFIVGREHEGLSSFWKKHADYQVKIPMVGKVNSLNVSVTSALLLFEAKKWMNRT